MKFTIWDSPLKIGFYHDKPLYYVHPKAPSLNNERKTLKNIMFTYHHKSFSLVEYEGQLLSNYLRYCDENEKDDIWLQYYLTLSSLNIDVHPFQENLVFCSNIPKDTYLEYGDIKIKTHGILVRIPPYYLTLSQGKLEDVQQKIQDLIPSEIRDEYSFEFESNTFHSKEYELLPEQPFFARPSLNPLSVSSRNYNAAGDKSILDDELIYYAERGMFDEIDEVLKVRYTNIETLVVLNTLVVFPEQGNVLRRYIERIWKKEFNPIELNDLWKIIKDSSDLYLKNNFLSKVAIQLKNNPDQYIDLKNIFS